MAVPSTAHSVPTSPSVSRNVPTLTRMGSSANIDFYRGSPTWGSVEVLIQDLVKVDGRWTVQKPARYRIRVFVRDDRYAEGVRIVEFTYAPKTPVKGMHLPDRTVTRLVRAEMKRIPWPSR